MTRKFLVPVLLPTDPQVALEAATKQYVDAKMKTAVQAPYQWSTTTTIADPGHGYLRANAAPASATSLAVSLYDSNNVARVGLLSTGVGSHVAVYFEGDLTKNVRYEVIADPTNNASEWMTMPVRYLVTGTGGFTPGNNERVMIDYGATGSAGETPDEVFIGTTQPAEPNTYELWYDPDAV